MKKIFNGDQFGVLTHHDLDGAGSAMMFRDVFHKQVATIKSCGYHKIIPVSSKFKCKNLVITDISLNQEQIDHIDSIMDEVVWIDHHESSLAFKTPDHWKVMINMKACGTKLSYLYLKHLGAMFTNDCADFVEIVNDFDMWILKIPESKLMNNLFWDMNFFGFINTFQNFEISEKMLQKAQALQDVKDAEIAEFSNYVIEGILRVVVADDHISDISLFYTNEKNFVIIRNGGCMSLRSEHDMQPFFEEINKQGITGGGHKHAGGCELKGTPHENDEMFLIEMFYNWLKEQE
jgi:oligoribonuclease NrnB/cAMP/cGMP phosphodiesterase (DHH superfamily)